MINDQIKKLTHGLRVLGIHSSFEARANEAQAKSLSHLEFLRLVLEDELLARKQRIAKALLTRAKFRSAVDLEDWDQSFDRGITKTKLRDLASQGFLHSNENLIILGKTGEGKSHLAMAVGRRLCTDNVSTLFIPVNFLFEEVMAAKAAGKYLTYIRKLTAVRVLVLDDFGLRNYTHEEANVLVDLLEDRHRKGSVIVTSQADPKGWGKLFEDPVIAEAIVNRLEHPSQRINLKGGSYREKLQMAAQNKKKVVAEKLLN